MTEPTKACNLTQWEIKQLIDWHGCALTDKNRDDKIERINYLNKRLKEFNKPEIKFKSDAAQDAVNAAAASSWGNSNGS